jgi:hypothetical protein
MFCKQSDAFQQFLTASKHVLDFKRRPSLMYCSKTESSTIGNQSQGQMRFFRSN